MDMMELRFRMMAMIGGSSMVGELSKYEKKTLTFPNAADSSTWETGAIIPCSFDPKIIVFSTPDDNTSGTIYTGVLCLIGESTNYYSGGSRARGTNGSLTGYYYYYNATASANRFKYDNGNIYICRASSGVFWNPNKTYTFEIYG